MLEVSSNKKSRVNLLDYEYDQDVQNRILLSDFSSLDVEVLDEILYSPLKISIKKLIKAISCEEEELASTLKKLARSNLLEIDGEFIVVDKEKRKYFEIEIERFSPNFKPDMEFLQNLLKKVPIQALPTWYAIPRNSNSIFSSIIEKYLLTPLLYQRYLSEQNFQDPVVDSIVYDLFHSEDFKISSSDLIAKYNLPRSRFEEIMILLELHFIACVIYEKQDDYWLESISAFHEWKTYLEFKKTSTPGSIENEDEISEKKENFFFVDQMSHLLTSPSEAAAEGPALQKLLLLKLAELEGNRLKVTESGRAWLKLKPEEKALYLYRHPQNQALSLAYSDKWVREAEKSIERALAGSWVYFDDFLRGTLVPLSEESVITLKKTGKTWGYSLPHYTSKEVSLLKATIFEWLFELGITSVGTHKGKDCFCITNFGKFFFFG